MTDFPLLSIIIFLPLVGAIILLALPGLGEKVHYWLSVIFALATFGVTVGLLLTFVDGNKTGFHWNEKLEWLKVLGMNYQVGADSISAWLIALTGFITVIAIFSAKSVTYKPRIFYAWMLVMESGMLGVFAATNLLNFYVFWEVMIIPAYFLIGQWGVTGDRVKSAIRFVLYTLVGSLLMLVAILAIAFLTAPNGGTPNLDIAVLRERIAALDSGTQTWLFLGFAVAFAVKVPLVPFQAWQPDAYADAPTPVTMMISGVMSKTGAYGFLRYGVLLFPTPAANFAPLICTLALLSIIYGAVIALGQRDLKRLLAYSSLSHTGFIVLGIFAINEQGVSGAVLQMVNHGIVTPALFLAAMALAARTGTTEIPYMSGLQDKMPRLGALFLILTLASMGLPGLNQFAGEFLIVGGAWKSAPVYGAVAVVGVVLAAWYAIKMFQNVWHGPKGALLEATEAVKGNKPMLPDMHPVEYVMFVPLVILIVLLGIAPVLVTGILDPTVQNWLGTAAKIAVGK